MHKSNSPKTNLQRLLVVSVHLLIEVGHCFWHIQLFHLDCLSLCTDERFIREVSVHYTYQLANLERVAHGRTNLVDEDQ